MAVVIQVLPVLDGHTNGDVEMDEVAGQARFTSGLILPPPEIKSVIDRTALFVAKSANPPQFEDKIRENQRSDPKFSFLNPADPYHAYYRNRMDKIAAGDLGDETSADKDGKAEGDAEAQPLVPMDIGLEPPTPEFIMDLPNISAIDLDIMKLTALFTARRGRNFLATLSAREGRNYQFDFLRPNHSLFGYFNRMVEQYSKIIDPPKEVREQLQKRNAEGARWETLELARNHAKWERNKREQDRKRKDDDEAEKIAFAEIDWNDYAIVQTIEFTTADANSELPPPMSVQEVENMTLTQKRMAAMIMEDTSGDVEALRAQQAAAEAAAAASVGGAGIADEDATMDQSDDEDDIAIARRKREQEDREKEIERARAIQANSVNATGPMKIRTDYVPKLGAKKGAAMTTCTICGQQIAVDELDEHMRIELLDPKWKSQRDILEGRKAQASELQRGANVVSSLKNLARSRVDIFGGEADEEKRKRQEEEEKEKRKEREKVVWDGHTASKENTLNKFQTNVNFDEQIAAIHRAKGLGPEATGAIGPGIGPAAGPAPMAGLPPAPASLPSVPQASSSGQYSAATVSSGPQPASMFGAQTVMLPPLHYQGLDAAQPFGYQPAQPGSTATPPGMHPSRIAALAAGGSTPQAGTVRSADEMEGVEGMPPAKRQKVAKLPGGQYYPEADWINMHPHPISLRVQLPTDPSKPEWKLDGTVVTIPDLPLTLLVSTLRDRILQHTGSGMPTSKMRLAYAGKMLTNAHSIASFNLEDEDELMLSMSETKAKKR